MEERRKQQVKAAQQRHRARLKIAGITEASFKVKESTWQSICRLAAEKYPSDGPYIARSKLLESLVNG